MKYLLTIFIFLLSFSANAVADCKNAKTTVEMNECTAEEQQVVEKKLNEVYQRLLKQLGDTELKQKIVIAQRAWVKFREADCKALYTKYADGSIRTDMFLTCMQTHAEQRIKGLEENFIVP